MNQANPPKEQRDPISDMMTVISGAGYTNFQKSNRWESALCAMVLALEPHCKTYRLLEALPNRHRLFEPMDVLNCFANLGYFSRSADSMVCDVDVRLYPCLFITQGDEPIVLLEDAGDAIILYRDGTVQEISRRSLKQVSGKLWVFDRFDEARSPTSSFMRAGSGHSWFRALLGRFKGTFGQVMGAGLILNIVALSTPLFIMLVYDRVIASGSLETLPMLTIGAGLAILFEFILRRIRSRGLSWLAARMDNIVSNQIFAHLIGLSPALIERASVAAQVARLKTFESVRDFFSGSVFLSMMELPFVALAAVAIYAIAGPLVFVPLTMAGIFCLLYYVVQRRVKVVIRLAAKATSARQQFTLETFEKIRGVRGYGLTRKWNERFRDLSGKEMIAHFHLNWLGMMAENTANALTLLAAVATVGFGVHMIWAGMMTTGALVASMILVWRILTPFYSMCTMIPRLEQLRHSILQVNKLMDIDTEAVEAKSRARLARIRGSVSFVHASLRYNEDSDRIFNDLHFEAKAGDMVVLTGENGAGKTSILKMLKGLYKPESGAVQIDGFDIRQLDAADLRRQISYVPQQPDFFQGTILENMRVGNPLASEKDVEAALVAADAWDDVAALPEGMRTQIARHGGMALPSSLLSRMSLARAYLHGAPILLIDEIPNALLSGKTGRKLKDFLAQIKGKRTVFMITYREDFMRLADMVVTMRRGEMPYIEHSHAKPNQTEQEAA